MTSKGFLEKSLTKTTRFIEKSLTKIQAVLKKPTKNNESVWIIS
jgi:hypothetical protein